MPRQGPVGTVLPHKQAQAPASPLGLRLLELLIESEDRALGIMGKFTSGQRSQQDKRGQRACLLDTVPNSPSQKMGILFVDTGLAYVRNKLRMERHCVCHREPLAHRLTPRCLVRPRACASGSPSPDSIHVTPKTGPREGDCDCQCTAH